MGFFLEVVKANVAKIWFKKTEPTRISYLGFWVLAGDAAPSP
ncbi:MAG: hypothetical protein ACJA2Q_002220 [Pseudohongiellaceae bacterium]|jgi:hypothetical protein